MILDIMMLFLEHVLDAVSAGILFAILGTVSPKVDAHFWWVFNFYTLLFCQDDPNSLALKHTLVQQNWPNEQWL